MQEKRSVYYQTCAQQKPGIADTRDQWFRASVGFNAYPGNSMKKKAGLHDGGGLMS